jgi:hypothetical protein
VPAASIALIVDIEPKLPPDGAIKNGAREIEPAKLGATGLSDNSLSASLVHKAAVIVDEKVLPADATFAFAPALVSQLAEGPLAQLVCVVEDAVTVLAAIPKPAGTDFTEAVPLSANAGVVLVAAVFKVAERLNCPVSICFNHSVVVALLSKLSPLTLVEAG